jgi:hypothetical protein
MHFIIREVKTKTPAVDAHPTSGIPRSHMINFGSLRVQPEPHDSLQNYHLLDKTINSNPRRHSSPLELNICRHIKTSRTACSEQEMMQNTTTTHPHKIARVGMWWRSGALDSGSTKVPLARAESLTA